MLVEIGKTHDLTPRESGELDRNRVIDKDGTEIVPSWERPLPADMQGTPLGDFLSDPATKCPGSSTDRFIWHVEHMGYLWAEKVMTAEEALKEILHDVVFVSPL